MSQINVKLKATKSLSPANRKQYPLIEKSTMKDNGTIIKIDFEEEVKIMRSAHKILVRKHQDSMGYKDHDKLPNKNMDDFLNFTTVKGMLDELVIPVINTIPKIR